MRVFVVGDVQSPHTRRWVTMYTDAGDDVMVAGFGVSSDLDAGFTSLGEAALSARRYAVAVPRLRRAIRAFRPDVVNALFVSSYGVATALARPSAPLVLGAWGSDVLWLPRRSRWHRKAIRWALDRAALVTYDSDDVQRAIVAAVPTARTLRVVFGPESSWLDGEPAAGKRILSPRALDPFYGIGTIVEAFSMARRNGLDWDLDILTYGMDHSELTAAVHALGIDDAVRFHGRLDRKDVRDLFGECEVFCSVPSSDATAATLLEGMAAGSFPVVSDLPATYEWIQDGLNGLIVPHDDSRILAEALGRACSDEHLRKDAARRNRALIQEQATWECSAAIARREIGRLAAKA